VRGTTRHLADKQQKSVPPLHRSPCLDRTTSRTSRKPSAE
jgi:hypothetical protein